MADKKSLSTNASTPIATGSSAKEAPSFVQPPQPPASRTGTAAPPPTPVAPNTAPTAQSTPFLTAPLTNTASTVAGAAAGSNTPYSPHLSLLTANLPPPQFQAYTPSPQLHTDFLASNHHRASFGMSNRSAIIPTTAVKSPDSGADSTRSAIVPSLNMDASRVAGTETDIVLQIQKLQRELSVRQEAAAQNPTPKSSLLAAQPLTKSNNSPPALPPLTTPLNKAAAPATLNTAAIIAGSTAGGIVSTALPITTIGASAASPTPKAEGANTTAAAAAPGATSAPDTPAPPNELLSRGGRLLIVANRLPFSMKVKNRKASVPAPSPASAASKAHKREAKQLSIATAKNAAAAKAAAAAAAAAAGGGDKPKPPAAPTHAHDHKSHLHPSGAAHGGMVTSTAGSSGGAPIPSPANAATSATQKPGAAPTGKDSKDDHEITFEMSSGGLVSALKGLKSLEGKMLWIGWPGTELASEADQRTATTELRKHSCLPVFLSQHLSDLYYNGFSNDVLWPLFHYIPLNIDSIHKANQEFVAYEQANMAFARVVLDIYEEGDTVWVHDYHLMLLPALLRAHNPHMKIAFFLHTPFPSSEIYRMLPCRRELLKGVLAANLLGFHTNDYSRHFQTSCTRILGALTNSESVQYNGHVTFVGAFPIGIEPERFTRAIGTPGVDKLVQDLSMKFIGRRVILGIDRLDYIKGIPHKLYALERFLELNPRWIGKVVLVQIAVPSRTDVPEYQRLRSQTHQLVGRINGRFGSLASVPIHYLDQSIQFDMMCALYRVADVMLISSVRDGMNLVAYEYIACQKDRAGVLIISEFAGAAQSLGAGAIQVNPWDVHDLAIAMNCALCMSPDERREYHAYAFQHVMKHTAEHWAQTFLSSLQARSAEIDALALQTKMKQAKVPDPLDFDHVAAAFAKSRHRLVIVGLVGTLIPDLCAIAAERRDTRFRSSFPTSFPQQHQAIHNHESKQFAFVPSNGQQPLTPNLLPATTVPTSSGASGAPTATPAPAAAGSTPKLSHSTSFPSSVVASNAVAAAIANLAPIAHGQQQSNTNPSPAASPHGGEDAQATAAAAAAAAAATKPNPALLALIRKLANDPNTTFVLLTARGRIQLDELLGQTPAWLAAENGFFMKRGGRSADGGDQWEAANDNVDLSWREGVQRVFEYFTERTPRTYQENGESLMSWHYHNAEPSFAKQQANDMVTHLTGGPLSNTSTELIDHSSIIIVRPLGVSKGIAAETIFDELQELGYQQKAALDLEEDEDSDTGSQTGGSGWRKGPVDFAIALGSFFDRDEDVFQVMNDIADAAHLESTIAATASAAAAASTASATGTASTEDPNTAISGTAVPTSTDHWAMGDDDETTTSGAADTAFQPLPRRSAARRLLVDKRKPASGAAATSTSTGALSARGGGGSASSVSDNTTSISAPNTATNANANANAAASGVASVHASPMLSAVPISLDDKQKEKSAIKPVYTISVGEKQSRARHFVKDIAGVEALLSRLAHVIDQPPPPSAAAAARRLSVSSTAAVRVGGAAGNNNSASNGGSASARSSIVSTTISNPRASPSLRSNGSSGSGRPPQSPQKQPLALTPRTTTTTPPSSNALKNGQPQPTKPNASPSAVVDCSSADIRWDQSDSVSASSAGGANPKDTSADHSASWHWD